MDCVYRVWKTDIMEPGTVYASELSNFFDVGVRNVHIGKQFAIITGMGSKFMEVAGQLGSFNPVEQKHPVGSSRHGSDVGEFES